MQNGPFHLRCTVLAFSGNGAKRSVPRSVPFLNNFAESLHRHVQQSSELYFSKPARLFRGPVESR